MKVPNDQLHIFQLDELLHKPILTCQVCKKKFPSPDGKILKTSSSNYSMITTLCSKDHANQFIKDFLMKAGTKGVNLDEFSFSYIQSRTD